MAKHLYITNSEGGYFYRFHPKTRKVVTKFKEQKELTLFDIDYPLPPEDQSHDNVAKSLHGKFIDKYHDHKHHTISLHVCAELILTDIFTGIQEIRTLHSEVIIRVPDAIYKYPFVKDKIYLLTVDSITEL